MNIYRNPPRWYAPAVCLLAVLVVGAAMLLRPA